MKKGFVSGCMHYGRDGGPRIDIATGVQNFSNDSKAILEHFVGLIRTKGYWIMVKGGKSLNALDIPKGWQGIYGYYGPSLIRLVYPSTMTATQALKDIDAAEKGCLPIWIPMAFILADMGISNGVDSCFYANSIAHLAPLFEHTGSSDARPLSGREIDEIARTLLAKFSRENLINAFTELTSTDSARVCLSIARQAWNPNALELPGLRECIAFAHYGDEVFRPVESHKVITTAL